MPSNFDTTLQEIENIKSQLELTQDLYSKSLWLLGSISALAWDWDHDFGLDFETREYKRAEQVLHNIHDQASELYKIMFDFKYTGEIKE